MYEALFTRPGQLGLGSFELQCLGLRISGLHRALGFLD